MGVGSSSSKLAPLRKAIRENDPSLTEVNVDGLQLTDKAVRKLSDVLRLNRSVLNMLKVNYSRNLLLSTVYETARSHPLSSTREAVPPRGDVCSTAIASLSLGHYDFQ